MKTASLFLAPLLLCASTLAATPALADASPRGEGTWEGTGTASDVQGTTSSPFTITLVRRAVGAGKVRTDGTVKTADKRTITFWQETEDAGPPPGAAAAARGGQGAARAFKIVSSNGTGGGRCFENGMCQSYEQRADGHAFATTLAIDGEGKLRVLVTELEGGRAVRFFDQTLLKRP